jgi:hypothetical protein
MTLGVQRITSREPTIPARPKPVLMILLGKDAGQGPQQGAEIGSPARRQAHRTDPSTAGVGGAVACIWPAWCALFGMRSITAFGRLASVEPTRDGTVSQGRL